MTTATKETKEHKGSVDSLLEREVAYKPIGEKETIKLTVALVLKFLMPPTKNGIRASHDDALKFVMLCRARELNPWTGDAYAVGYEESGPNGIVAKYNLITSVQALYKRAELCPEYDGIESGIIVRAKQRGEGPRPEVEYREGDFFDGEEEVLLGGWARVYRGDKKKPDDEAVKLSTFQKGTPIWKNNPEGMISKVAEAGALRKAFPNQLGGLYIHEEMTDDRTVEPDKPPQVVNDLDDITNEINEKRGAVAAIEENPSQTITEVIDKAKDSSPEKETVKAKQGSRSQAKKSQEPDDESLAQFSQFKDLIADAQSSVDAEIIKESISNCSVLEPDQVKFLLGRLEQKQLDDA